MWKPTSSLPVVLQHSTCQVEPLLVLMGILRSTEHFPVLYQAPCEVYKAHLGGPKQIMSARSKVKGGVISAGSPCDLPQIERQIAYIQFASNHQVLTTPTLKAPLADQIFLPSCKRQRLGIAMVSSYATHDQLLNQHSHLPETNNFLILKDFARS